MQNDILIRQLKEKNQRAFGQLYDNYSESIYGVIYTILQDQNLAEETLQDVFLKIWEKADTYTQSKGRFFTWILNIARNAAIDKTRSKAFKQKNKNTSFENFQNLIADQSDDAKSTNNTVANTVKKLKPLCVKLIDMLYFKGYTQDETSKTLDTPLGTIKSRSRSCLKQLRESINNAQL